MYYSKQKVKYLLREKVRLYENLPHFVGKFEGRSAFVDNFEFDVIFECPDDVFLEIVKD